MVSGACAAITGIIIASELTSAAPQAGKTFELNAIAAVVIGGAALSGGRGNVRGTLVGAFVIGFLADGLVILGVSTFWQIFIKGAVIILAVMLDQGQQRFQRKGAAVAATVEAEHEPHRSRRQHVDRHRHTHFAERDFYPAQKATQNPRVRHPLQEVTHMFRIIDARHGPAVRRGRRRWRPGAEWVRQQRLSRRRAPAATRQKSSNYIAIITPSPDNPFFKAEGDAAKAKAEELGYKAYCRVPRRRPEQAERAGRRRDLAQGGGDHPRQRGRRRVHRSGAEGEGRRHPGLPHRP